MKSYLKNYRQSPRKVRLVADLVRGKKIDKALTDINFAYKRAGGPIAKLIMSAVNNAKNNDGISIDNLFVKEIRVDKGIVMKRVMPRARGSASRINKRSSHIMVTLGEKAAKVEKPKKIAKK